MQSGESRCEIEGIRQEIGDNYILPLIPLDVESLNVYLFVLGNAETVDKIFVCTSRLMRLYAVQLTYFSPLLQLQTVPQALLGPLTLVDHAANQVDELVVVDQAVGWVHCVGQFGQFEDLGRS